MSRMDSASGVQTLIFLACVKGFRLTNTGDTVQFAEFVERNMRLYSIRYVRLIAHD